MSALPEAGPTRALLVRALLYFALWIVVDQSAKPANLVVGLLASAAATWASLKLLPPASGRVRLGLLLLLLPRFLWQSLVAGTDVARRAFAPELPEEIIARRSKGTPTGFVDPGHAQLHGCRRSCATASAARAEASRRSA